MPRLKLPEGSGNVGYGTWHFTPDADGCIETGDAPADVVAAIIAHAGAREATDEDVAAADLAAVQTEAVEVVQHTKETLLAKLREMGVTDVDGRKSITVLQRKFDEASAKQEAAAKIAEEAAAKAAAAAKVVADAEAAAAQKAAADAAEKAAADALAKATAEQKAAEKAAADAAAK